MISRQQINQLIQEENADAINSVYWELPAETQRIINQLIAKHWNKEVSELEELYDPKPNN